MCDVHQNKKFILIFIDFSSAFDSVNWEAMESILLKGFLIPPELVAAIMSLYRGSKVRVRQEDLYSQDIPVTGGVLAGDTLAPLLFVESATVQLIIGNSLDIRIE